MNFLGGVAKITPVVFIYWTSDGLGLPRLNGYKSICVCPTVSSPRVIRTLVD